MNVISRPFLIKLPTYLKQYLYYQGGNYSREETVQGGNYILEKVFDWGNNSREDTIQGRILIKEISYGMHILLILIRVCMSCFNRDTDYGHPMKA